MKKAGFIFGAEYGHADSLFAATQRWLERAGCDTLRMEGGSFGFQIGASARRMWCFSS